MAKWIDRGLAYAAALCLSLSIASAAYAQMEKSDAPISATAKPDSAVSGTTITIAGSSVMFGKTAQEAKSGTVKIAIAPPSGAAVNLEVKLKDDGSFSTNYKAPAAPGKYKITLTAADGKGTATTGFTVLAPTDLGNQAASSANDLGAAMINAQAAAKKMVDSLPPSPARDQLSKKLDELGAALPELNVDLGKAIGGMNQVAQYLQAHPDQIAGDGGKSGGPAPDAIPPDVDNPPTEMDPSRPPAEDLFVGLQSYAGAAEKRRVQINQLLEQSKEAGANCDRLDNVVELTNTISLALNYEKNILKFALGMFNDKRWGTGADAAAPTADANTKFALVETVKSAFAAAALGALESKTKFVGGILNDIGGMLAGKGFDAYCVKYEGPMTGHFEVRLRADNGKQWLHYSYDLEGKFTLRYAQQDAAAQSGNVHAYALSGQIEGNANNFQADEDAVQIDPRVRPYIVFRKAFLPLGARYVEELGLAGRAATPAYFRVPVKGTMVDNKVTLHVQPAFIDFTPLVQFQIVLVFADPVTGVPLLQKANMPAQNGFFIVDRVLRNDPDKSAADDPPTLQAKPDGDKTTMEREFTRHYNDDKAGITVDWKLNLKACNPSCMPTDKLTGLQPK